MFLFGFSHCHSRLSFGLFVYITKLFIAWFVFSSKATLFRVCDVCLLLFADICVRERIAVCANWFAAHIQYPHTTDADAFRRIFIYIYIYSIRRGAPVCWSCGAAAAVAAILTLLFLLIRYRLLYVYVRSLVSSRRTLRNGLLWCWDVWWFGVILQCVCV